MDDPTTELQVDCKHLSKNRCQITEYRGQTKNREDQILHSNISKKAAFIFRWCCHVSDTWPPDLNSLFPLSPHMQSYRPASGSEAKVITCKWFKWSANRLISQRTRRECLNLTFPPGPTKLLISQKHLQLPERPCLCYQQLATAN